ncbi:hypothetical protein [Syntrophus gentianae]|uniref:hypothetical protein n=1 Tax=Syntrophus gentianae TaxID=43775 RepID=UPI001F1606B2|nr:hypothetical protein [Syntrophus gentianae]
MAEGKAVAKRIGIQPLLAIHGKFRNMGNDSRPAESGEADSEEREEELERRDTHIRTYIGLIETMAMIHTLVFPDFFHLFPPLYSWPGIDCQAIWPPSVTVPFGVDRNRDPRDDDRHPLDLQ